MKPRASDLIVGVFPLLALRLGDHFGWLLGIGRVPGMALLVFSLSWMVGYPLWIRRRREQQPEIRPRPPKILLELLLALPLFLALMWIANIVAVVTWGFWGEPGGAEPIPTDGAVANAAGWWLAVFAVSMCVVGPIGEELFFRGFLFRWFRPWCGGVLATLVQAGAFALFHPYGAHQQTALFVVGILLQLITLWRKTILAPIFVHAFVNTAVLAITLQAAAQPKPFLGVRWAPDAETCRVESVFPDSSAAAAGIRAGDVITAFDGQVVGPPKDFSLLIRAKHVGDRVRIEFQRDGKTATVEAVLGEAPDG